MFINFKCLLSTVLLFSFVMPVFSFEPSGGVLSLDGEDDYAILPLAEHGYIIPRNTEAFTVEVWFHPKSEPKKKERHLVLGQQVLIGLSAEDKCDLNQNQLCSYGQAFLDGIFGGRETNASIGIDVPIEKDQWNYRAVIFKDSTLFMAYNDELLSTSRIRVVDFVGARVPLPREFQDFFVGGYAEDFVVVKDGQLLVQTTHFRGAIDAIRFSNIARYDLPATHGIWQFDPPHRFVSDEHTLALWDFNDKEGADRFEDTSGNGKTLIGMNGAAVVGGGGIGNLEIRPDTSLTTTWGQVKSEAF